MPDGHIDPESGLSPDLSPALAGRLRVAVYGTLKRGRTNHHFLRGARFLGEERLPHLRLYDLGPYPGAVPGRSGSITVEMYEITPAHLSRLDWLEDCRQDLPAVGLYRRQQVATRCGPAWLYLYNRSVRGRRWLRSGRW